MVNTTAIQLKGISMSGWYLTKPFIFKGINKKINYFFYE